MLFRREIGNLGAEMDGVRGRVERCDAPNAGLAREQRCPEIAPSGPDRRDDTESGDDDPLHAIRGGYGCLAAAGARCRKTAVTASFTFVIALNSSSKSSIL